MSTKKIDSIFNNLIGIIGESIQSLDSIKLIKNTFHETKKENNVVSQSSNISINNLDNVENKENIDSLPKTQDAPAFLTQLGKEKIKVNEELKFRTEKKRSIKNLFSVVLSPFKYISRMTLDIKTNRFNTNANTIDLLNEFKLDEVKNSNDISFKTINEFKERLKLLSKIFESNINKVEEKKSKAIKQSKFDISLKNYTLEKALECKLVHNINTLKKELINDLAKDKFNHLYPNILEGIKSGINIILSKSIDQNNIDYLLSPNSIGILKDKIANVINDPNKGVYFDNDIIKTLESVINKNYKEEIKKSGKGNVDEMKNEILLNIVKNLFTNIANDERFIGENEVIKKIDLLQKAISQSLSKNLGKISNKLVNQLNDNFYDNIKKNDKGNDLLTRLFKNSSNNINYKWAQDAIVLLINYETFSNKTDDISNYSNNGVRSAGGIGSEVNKKSQLQFDLKKIFNRLDLDESNIEKCKDDILRKYFANYFEHI